MAGRSPRFGCPRSYDRVVAVLRVPGGELYYQAEGDGIAVVLAHPAGALSVRLPQHPNRGDDSGADRSVESEGEGVLRVAALANLAFLLYLSDDPARARHVLSQAIRDPLAQRRPYGFITALTTSALIALDEGDADNGQHAAARALEFATAAGLADNQVSALAHVALGRALTAAGRPDSARTEIEHGVRLLRGGVMPAQQIYALLWAAPAAHAAGDLRSALALTEEAAELRAASTTRAC